MAQRHMRASFDFVFKAPMAPEASELQGLCCKNQTSSLVATEEKVYLIFIKMLLKTG